MVNACHGVKLHANTDLYHALVLLPTRGAERLKMRLFYRLLKSRDHVGYTIQRSRILSPS